MSFWYRNLPNYADDLDGNILYPRFMFMGDGYGFSIGPDTDLDLLPPTLAALVFDDDFNEITATPGNTSETQIWVSETENGTYTLLATLDPGETDYLHDVTE